MIVTIDTTFKKCLIAKIKEYTDVLNGNMKTETAWIEIEKALNLPLKAIKNLWYSIKRQYYDILMNRTIERDNSPSEWELFHDMSFMYNITKENIQKNIGGLSPPLLQPLKATNGSPREPCPCCIPVHSETIEIEESDSETLLESPQIEQQMVVQSVILEESIQPVALNDSWSTTDQINPIADIVSNQDWTHNLVIHTPDSMGLDPGWITNSEVEPPYPMVINQGWITNYEIQPSEAIISNQNPGSDNQIPPPNEVLASDSQNQPLPQASTSKLKKRPRANRYGLNNTLQERVNLRTKIIAAIKQHSVLYVKDLNCPKGTLQSAWNNVTKEIGDGLPKMVIQNRWRSAKQKFVEELIKERYSLDKPFISKFENYDQMEFMRSHLQSEVDEIDQLRKEIQTIVQNEKNNKNNNTFPTIDLCEDEDDPSPSNQSTVTQPENLDSLTLDLTNEDAENTQSFSSDNYGLDTYQKRFERSIMSVKLIPSDEPPDAPKNVEQLRRVLKKMRHDPIPIEPKPVAVFEIDYSSDEELDKTEMCAEEGSQASDSELEMYSEELIYISEPSTTICLDDDD